MENRKETAIEMMARLANLGTDYSIIAKEVSKAGHKTPTGLSHSKQSVSKALRDIGIKHFTNGVKSTTKPTVKIRRRKRRKLTSLGNPEPVVTKYDLLRSIELCQDFTTSSRKALMDLVWKEVNK